MKDQWKQSKLLIVVSLVMLFSMIGGTWSIASGAQLNLFAVPTFQIVSVATDQTVTIRTSNFPANDTFNVLMNYIGTRGVGGWQVTTVNSGAGGSFTATFTIPEQLRGQRQIAIRLESPTSPYYSYNWFYNNTTTTVTPGIPPTGDGTATPVAPLPPGVIPTIAIVSVVADQTVTIETRNYPANDNFNVLMNYRGTRGVGGWQVGTFASGAGGTQTATFNIPEQLRGQRQIAIRLESPTSRYFSYNWFYNSSTAVVTPGIPPTGPTPTPGVVRNTTISIVSVVQDTSVTIQTNDYPANDSFTVLMNYRGTRGVGGWQVATFNSGAGGTQTATFTIPEQLRGQRQIAIRLQSPTSGYYSYNWFHNNTAP